ncbi:hypothetical protein GCM10023187_53330 [Nibrella viscosa]|uniref:Multi-ubiquitin domain-containing protein n=1 Tax=Nibrella viscosa TaxID=1084524 RepID=A0ABP8KYI1_9BACT
MNASQERNEASKLPPGQQITIIVNGRQHAVTKQDISFSDLVALSNTPTGPNVTYTITYRRGQGNKPEGSLVEGETVKLKDGMIFNVTPTDKS